MRTHWRLSALLATGLAVAACGAGTAGSAAGSPAARSDLAATRAVSGPEAGDLNVAAPGASPAGGSATKKKKPLAGKVIGIDPGHNGRNKDDPSYIDRQVWNGREWEDCNTTGTETDSGYTEARFNWNVANDLRRDLRKLGARVVMTRKNNRGVGPCVTRRARIINRAHADVGIDIHADGGPASGRGFTVLQPVADGPNDKVITPSVRFGHDVRAALLKHTRMPESDYYGHKGLIFRDDLAGLNLTRVPLILIETGNMRNATDARLLARAWFQRRLAIAFTYAIRNFLRQR